MRPCPTIRARSGERNDSRSHLGQSQSLLRRHPAVRVIRIDDKVNLAEKIGLLEKLYSPGILDRSNALEAASLPD